MSNRHGSKECNEPDCNEFGIHSDYVYLFCIVCVSFVWHTHANTSCTRVYMHIDKAYIKDIYYIAPLSQSSNIVDLCTKSFKYPQERKYAL